jgi:type I restriction-modification system DNA methylase subunit
MSLQKRFNFGRSGSLFNRKTVNRAFTRIVFDPSDAQRKAASHWAEQVRHANFKKAKEEEIRGEFIQNVLVTILGYTPYRADGSFTLAEEETLGKGSVDTALGEFSAKVRTVLAPFELKGPKTRDLDAIMSGRNKSPIQQAWEYAIDAPGAKWVLVSNCAEIRLYAFGHGREQYEIFDLALLDDPKEHERLWLLLGAKFLITGRTAELLAHSAIEQKDITNKLYSDYKKTRDTLIQTLQVETPRLAPLAAIEHAQTILDRVLFIAFAEGTALLPERLIYEAWNRKSPFRPNGAWENFVGLFEAVDKGNAALDIPAYNGGLFAKNAIIDALRLSNFVCENFAKIADYDFASDVSVTVLGHIFEQSVSDIEAMRAQAQGLEPSTTTKRKRDGVVYTPDFVTRFIVEETIGKTLSEKFAESLAAHGVTLRDDGVYSWSKALERDVWRDYRNALHALTIVDPACGSGAFLIAAFDYLAAEYRRVGIRLAALGGASDGDDIEREILAGNLHGVDLNPEPIEITKLSLWLKTAKRGKLLQDLNANIKCGNSLIGESSEHGRAFDWRMEFPHVFENGGFDIVLGNPPYVRMEILKPFKPYLEKHFSVASDRADLYAYFFERGFELLRTGGRLGYISSSTFLRTGSGEPLRHFLRTRAEIETVVDFGDVQIFEGVTTYPAILTMRRAENATIKEAGQAGELQFLQIEDDAPKDLAKAFRAGAKIMPRARLGDGSWQFEDDALAALRAKIRVGKKTLGEVYGPPLYGIKTGLNEAFIVNREQRDALVKRDARSAELLIPFLRGENIKRWRVESEDLFLINTPKGKVRIDDYPAIRDHLLPFKQALEARATKQEWYELQQAQLAYQEIFRAPKIVYLDIANNQPFAFDEAGRFIDCTVFMIPNSDWRCLAILNSKVSWFQWIGETPLARGGYIRLKRQYIEPTSLPDANTEIDAKVSALAERASDAGQKRVEIQYSLLRRIPDLCPSERKPKLTNRLREWWALDFKAFQAEIKKAFKTDIPLKQRNEWETFLREEGDKVRRLTAEIEKAEREIDRLVYELFDLTPDEITLLESSLAGQY